VTVFTARCYAQRGLCPSVRPSVCPSVTRQYCIETAKHILVPFPPSGIATPFWSVRTKRYGNIPTGTTRMQRGMKNIDRDFRPISRFTSDRPMIHTEP